MTEIPPPGPGATVIDAIAHNGRPCRIVDNTGSIARDELERLLEDLIQGRHFGLRAVSASGSSEIRLGEPEFAHMQFGERIYRLLLFPYEARLEAF
ncbi:hypothetical protein TVNIR_1059 [Thioalkalivibrio nitratireducens DSM 14787]|uniref:Uncharacterized protein n=1 Tax=Thioalkalivibrio nitratireducens (strain DSM 14787 / UNIQEM 213 / ALEN2) TaxID=1255043 RepID=L0DUP3_THIND|nr:hypothetical protein [Thioalkalivibrio nitratireducens]AGA32743.1 hypothetical protein TVNIR_1059 [Thioalkalivibrio nitratireducens DSM 14787]